LEVPDELLARAPRECHSRAERIAGSGHRRCLADRADVGKVSTEIALATGNGFGRSTVPNWGRNDHGNASKHSNQTEVEGTHD